MTSKGSDQENHSSSESDIQLQRIQSNRKMLDLRQQVQWQNRVIRDLKIERDRLTKELASRLFFVEAQLLREQKHIESLLNEKDQYIRFQGLQIESLKCILSQVDHEYRNPQHGTSHRSRNASSMSSRRSKMNPPLSKRYSVALDEYMKDYGIVSRALPVVVQTDQEGDKKDCMHKSHSRCTRTLSLPELSFINPSENWGPVQCCIPFCDHVPDSPETENVIDELAARRWTSDCDSEHSDSLDSGISSPSIKSRSLHMDEMPSPISEDECQANLVPTTPRRRSSSIGSFLNRTFSSSSSNLEKINKSNSVENVGGRRHSSFSEVENGVAVHGLEPKAVEQKPRSRFISSANRNFGTNHRSVTKPRDIKFRKLFKFRRRPEPAEQTVIQCEDYMTV